MNNYVKILERCYGMVWAMAPEKLAVVRDFLLMKAQGVKMSDADIQAAVGAKPKPSEQRVGAVAVLPVFGIIAQRMDMMMDMSGGVSTERISNRFRALVEDDSVGAIVLDIDSPGGGVEGIQELAAEIYAARGQKKIVAIANSYAASAAYWIASAADEFVVTPSGKVGSIGVFMMHEDITQLLENEGIKTTLISSGQYKTEGTPYAPLTDEALAHFQSLSDSYYDMFTKDVAKYRGVKHSEVLKGYGEGRVFTAPVAKSMGMVDRIATLDEVVDGLYTARGQKGRMRSEERDRKISIMKMRQAGQASGTASDDVAPQ